jgi:hypothetical protein
MKVSPLIKKIMEFNKKRLFENLQVKSNGKKLTQKDLNQLLLLNHN